MSETEQRTSSGELVIEYYKKGEYGNFHQKVIHFCNLKQMLYSFRTFYRSEKPITYKIMRYCVDYSYFRNNSTKWYFQNRNVCDQHSGNEVNKDHISGLYFILDQYLFDKGEN